MKKFFKNTAILALGFGFAMTFTACHNNGEAYVESSIDDLVTVDKASKTLTIVYTKQQPSSVTYAGKTYTATANAANTEWTVVITDAKSTGTVKTTFPNNATTGKPDFYADNISVDFGEKEEILVRVKPFKGTSTLTTPLPAGTVTAAITVTNDSENRGEGQTGDGDGNEVTINADVNVPVGTTVTNPSGDPLAIIVYTPSDVSATSLEGTITEPVLAVSCQPDGATFTPYAEVTVDVPGLNGEEIFLQNSTNKNEKLVKGAGLTVAGTKLTAQVPHFSSWYYMLSADLLSAQATDEEVDHGEFNIAKAGNVKVPFTKYVGYEIVPLDNKTLHPVVKKFIQSLFGVQKKQVSATFNFAASSEGTLVWTVNQHVTEYYFRSGSVDFQVRVFGTVKPTGTFSAPEEPEYSHSGGSNL